MRKIVRLLVDISGVVLLNHLHLVRVVCLGLVLIQRGHHPAQFRVSALVPLALLLHDGSHLSILQWKPDRPIQIPHSPLHLQLPPPLLLRLLFQVHPVRLRLPHRVAADAVLVDLQGQLVGLGEEVAGGDAGMVLHAPELAPSPSQPIVEALNHLLEPVELPRGLVLLAVFHESPLRVHPCGAFAARRGGVLGQGGGAAPLGPVSRGGMRVLPLEGGAEVAGLASLDELVEFEMLVDWVLTCEFLDLALGESLADGLGLGELDAHIAEVPHLLPAPHLRQSNISNSSKPPFLSLLFTADYQQENSKNGCGFMCCFSAGKRIAVMASTSWIFISQNQQLIPKIIKFRLFVIFSAFRRLIVIPIAIIAFLLLFLSLLIMLLFPIIARIYGVGFSKRIERLFLGLEQ